MSGKPRPPLPRFMAKVQKTDACWIWTGARHHNGYGDFGVAHGRKMRAHRFAYETFVGPIPVGIEVCHRCDNPPCVRPDHLFLGTRADNVADKVRKERQARGAAIGHPGEKNGNAKLTAAAVLEIRESLERGESVGSVAARHGITERHVDGIATRERWRHV